MLAVAQGSGLANYHVRLASPSLKLANPVSTVQDVAEGDTLRATVAVSYDPNNTPYSLEKLEVELVDPDNHVLASVPAFVYFTPYKTVELWNRYDLDGLKRVWDAADPAGPVSRPYVDRNAIPLSDLSDQELADPEFRYKRRSIPGLAYTIPMRDTGQDAEEDDGDGPGEELGGLEQARLLTRHTWDATITGRVLTDQWDGRSSTVRANMPLTVTGIRVEVWDKDGLWDDFLASGHTDNNGNFSIHFRTTQGSEGSYLELYLNIVATTAGGTIRVIRRIGWTREGTVRNRNPIDLHYNTRTLSFNDTWPNHDDVKPHLVHYGFRSREFLAANQLGGVLPNSQSRPLKMMISPLNRAQNKAMFIPGGYRNPAAGAIIVAAGRFGIIGLGIGVVTASGLALYLSNDDCLYIGENRETEETAYHEFGHYAMWHMQNRSWANFLEAGFATHFYEANANNPKIAWTEGWSNGFAMIMDAATERYDGEREVDDNDYAHEERETFEELRYNVRRNGVVSPEFTLTNGFLSEYFIGTTLYDLWDGAATGAPFDDNNNSNFFRTNLPMRVGSVLDAATLSFSDLTAPIRNHPGNGIWGIGVFSSDVVQDITDYHRYLMEQTGDCDERRTRSNAFLINRISTFPNQAGLPRNAPAHRLGTDEIEQRIGFTEPRFDSENRAFEPAGTSQFTLTVDQNELAGALSSYNLASAAPSGAGRLSDPLTVRDGAYLGLNAGSERGRVGSGQFAPAGSSLAAELCGRMRLTLARDGHLEVGSAQGHTATATLGRGGVIDTQNGGTLRVHAGSVLVIAPGATLRLHNGSTLAVEGQVRVEDGGFICVEPGANFVFSAAAGLYIGPNARLETPVELNLPVLACTGQLPVCGQLTGGNGGVTNTGGGNEALLFDGGDVVTIGNNGSPVNNGLRQQFAIEAYVRADNLGLPGAQTIFSSRHNSPTGTNGYDGVLFSIYNGGQLLLQLGGVNYYGPANQLPNDLSCHHVAVTRDAQNRVRFYIDGWETGYAPLSGINGNTPGTLNLGADRLNPGPDEFFQGLVGEVRVWNTWRSGAQIRDRLTARLTPQPDLVAYYDMKDATGSATLSDLSGQMPAATGQLGTPAGGGADAPAWVSQCLLSCTVQGNFRTGAPAWASVDSVKLKKRRLLAHGSGQPLLALSIAPNPTAGGTTLLHFETRQAGPVRVWVQDLMGAERREVLPATVWPAGSHTLALPLGQLPPGLYLVLVQSGAHREHVRLEINP